jgi:hypothetical protein
VEPAVTRDRHVGRVERYVRVTVERRGGVGVTTGGVRPSVRLEVERARAEQRDEEHAQRRDESRRSRKSHAAVYPEVRPERCVQCIV